MSMRGTPAYLAPEIARGKKYSSNVDIYSLGILLYKLLNHGRYPFMPLAPQPIRFEDTDVLSCASVGSNYRIRRPASLNTALKACSYQPSERFQTPEEFKDKFLAVQQSWTAGTVQAEESPDANARVFLGGSSIVDSQRQVDKSSFSYSEKTTSPDDSEREKVMSKEAITLRRQEETNEQLERIHEQNEDKLNIIFNTILFLVACCVGVIGLILLNRWVNGAVAEEKLKMLLVHAGGE